MSEDLKKELGARIRDIRLTLKIKQKDFAEQMQISHTYVSEMENGVSNPSFLFLHKLASLYNVNLDYLFYGAKPVFRGEAPPDGRINSGLQPGEVYNGIGTVEELIRVMEKSNYFKFSILMYANRFHFENRFFIDNVLTKEQEGKDD